MRDAHYHLGFNPKIKGIKIKYRIFDRSVCRSLTIKTPSHTPSPRFLRIKVNAGLRISIYQNI